MRLATCRLVILALLASPLALAGQILPASATPNQYDVNLLGGHNTDGWGNAGGLWSSQWLADTVGFLHDLDPGSGYPLIVATQEICNGSGVSWAQQYDYLAVRLESYSSGYTEGFGIAKNTNFSNCADKGNAVFALANSDTATWAADNRTVYSQVDGEQRNLICVYPKLWVGGPTMNYVACSTHFATNASTATADSTEARNTFKAYAFTYGLPTLLGGDFNLSASHSSVLQWYSGSPPISEADSTIPGPYAYPQKTFCFSAPVHPCSLTKKIDYLWFEPFSRLAQANVLDPPTYLGVQASDHKMLVGHF